MGPGMGLDRDIVYTFFDCSLHTRATFRSDGASSWFSNKRDGFEFIHHGGYIKTNLNSVTCLFLTLCHECKEIIHSTGITRKLSHELRSVLETISVHLICIEAVYEWTRKNMRLDWYFCASSRDVRDARGLAETVSSTSFVAMTSEEMRFHLVSG